MGRDQALAPVAVVLLLALTMAATAGVVAFVMADGEPDAPTLAGFAVHEDEHRLRLQKTAGEPLPTANLELIVQADGESGSLPASQVPGLGGTWQTGESVCLAGQGPRCVQVDGADAVTGVRVAEPDQLLYEWEGTPELDELSAGGGPVLAVGADADGGEDGQPDLRATSLAANRSGVEEGDAVAFDVTVENAGDAPASATTVEVTVDGTTLTAALDALDPGASTTVRADTWTATGGDHTPSATVDPDHSVDDADRANDDTDTRLPVASEDPGHAYEDTDNDALFTPGTDQAIPDAEIHDGTYHVQDPWSLVIPDSVGAIQAAGVNYTAGDEGHVIVEPDVHSTDEGLRLIAGAYVDASGARLTTTDERAVLAAREGPVRANATTVETGDERVILRGAAAYAAEATLTSPAERVIADADGRVDLSGATVDAGERVPLTAGGDVMLEDATLTAPERLTADTASDAAVRVDGAHLADEDDTLTVQPDGAAIEGTPDHGDAQHGGAGGGGGPP